MKKKPTCIFIDLAKTLLNLSSFWRNSWIDIPSIQLACSPKDFCLDNLLGQACSVRGTNQTDPRQQMQLKYLWREWQSSTTTIFKNLIHYLFDWSRFPNSSKCLNSFSRSLRFLKLILIFCIYFLELFFVGHAVWRTMVNYSNTWL